jgi:hypothetical protein
MNEPAAQTAGSFYLRRKRHLATFGVIPDMVGRLPCRISPKDGRRATHAFLFDDHYPEQTP